MYQAVEVVYVLLSCDGTLLKPGGENKEETLKIFLTLPTLTDTLTHYY